MEQYARICDHVFTLFYELILYKLAPILFKESMQVISTIGYWYVNEDSTYLKIYETTKASHLLPRFVPDILVLKEVAYQTILHVLNASLIKDENKLCPTYPLH